MLGIACAACAQDPDDAASEPRATGARPAIAIDARPGGCALEPGDPGYCAACGPCELGHGHCDDDSGCSAGLMCAHDVGAAYGFTPETHVCVNPLCEWPPGHAAYCGDCGPCPAGVGGCQADRDCAAGLRCGGDRVCVAAPVRGERPCRTGTPISNHCRDCGPCPAGTGDCDGDEECAPGLRCVDNAGARYGYDRRVDVCE